MRGISRGQTRAGPSLPQFSVTPIRFDLEEICCRGFLPGPHWDFRPPLSVWPHLFRGAVVISKGGESSWSGPWHLVCALEVFHVHIPGPVPTARLGRVFLCVFSLGLYFVYSFVFLWFVCVHPSFYVSLGSWVVSLTVFGVSVTNLNEPPRALAASTTALVRSELHPFWAVVNKSNTG